MVNKKFFEELRELAAERYLDEADVLEVTKTALTKAVNVLGYDGQIDVDFNVEENKIKITETKYVVDAIDPEGPVGQILLEDAKAIKTRVKVGSTIKREISFQDFTRKAAARFKNVLDQGIKEMEKKRAYEYFQEKEGEIITGRVCHIGDNYFALDLGHNQKATLPLSEKTPNERLSDGLPMNVLITSVESTPKGPRVYVSRSHKTNVIRLFEQNVPEVSSGVIEIVGVARDPQNRTKVAVMSRDPNIEAKGACIGPQGSRIKIINEALGGEKIDIFNYSEDPVKYIAEALTPAKVIAVLIDEEHHRSTAIVPDDQLTLAIGRGGQNVRLACQVTGWKIDIKDETTAYREEIKFRPNVR